MYIAFFECIAVVWLYGVKRLSSNVRDMTGAYPNWFFRYCWMFFSPLLILAIWEVADKPFCFQSLTSVLFEQLSNPFEGMKNSEGFDPGSSLPRIFNLADYTAPTYDGYVFPAWAHAIGWLIAMSSIIAIPIFAFAQILKEKSSLKEVSNHPAEE